MTSDEAEGMAWWNSLDELTRAFWLRIASLQMGAVPSAADAWQQYKIWRVTEKFTTD